MQRSPIRSVACPARLPGFLAGVVTGALLAAAGAAVAQDEDRDRHFKSSVLYALSKLAVDTETNAARIVELNDRFDDLVLRIDDMSAEKK